MINSFTKENRFLSNFYSAIVTYENLTYPYSENAYQASKTLDLTERMQFLYLTPFEAKSKGQLLTLRPDWDQVKDQIMYDIVYDKFYRNIVLRRKLLATGDMILIEGNNWHDNYWGSCDCHRCRKILGQNKLGIILMKLRERFRLENG